MERLGIGVIGAGKIAQAICEHFSQKDVEDRAYLAAICDHAFERAKGTAQKYGIAKYYQTHEELLSDSGVDIVTICSPIGIHFEQGMEVIRTGKHVHFNKTMTTTVIEADTLISCAAERGIKIVASPGMMLFPHNQRARRLVLENILGQLVWAITGVSRAGEYHLHEQDRVADPSWYFRKPGGGPQYDVTVYCLHALTGILGPVQRLTALSGKAIPERVYQGQKIICETDDTTLLTLDFGGALLASVYATVEGSVTYGFEPNIYGTRGSIVGTMCGERDLTQPCDFQPHVIGVHRDMAESHVFEDVMQLVDWVQCGKPSVASAEHARHVIEIIEKGYLSAERGCTLNLHTSFEPMPLESLAE